MTGELRAVPIAEMLGLCCPDCGGQLKDRIGPFWCPACEKPVSAWHILALTVKAAHGIEMFKDAEKDDVREAAP